MAGYTHLHQRPPLRQGVIPLLRLWKTSNTKIYCDLKWTLIRNWFFRYCNYHKWNICQTSRVRACCQVLVPVWLASIVWHALVALKIWMANYEVWPLDDLKQVATSCKMSFPANMSPVLDVLIPHSTYIRVRISTNVHICAVIWQPYIRLGSFPSYLHSTLSF